MRLSEKPIRFAVAQRRRAARDAPSRGRASVRTISSISRRNHGSIAVSVVDLLDREPGAERLATQKSRCARGTRASARDRGRAPRPRRRSPGRFPSGDSKPQRSISRPRIAFWRLSWKVRPIAITSPTDFICVVRVSSAPLNFSKAKRGTFVTT